MGDVRLTPWPKRLVLLVALVVGVWAMLRWLERSLVYIPSNRLAATGGELGRPFEDVFFAASDGVRLHGWFYPADSQSPRAHLVILHLHGNAGNISHRLDYYQAWLELGVAVFAFDYRGYGRSTGRPTEEGTCRDAQAACAWLRQKGFQLTNVIALGESLGGGVAADLATRLTLGGLVLQSTFTSIRAVGGELYPWLPVRLMSTIRYDTRAKLPSIQCPVLVMHSRDDELIRFHHGQRNFAAAREPKIFWELSGDHNGTLEAGRTRYLEGLAKFLATFFNKPASRPSP